MGDPRTDEELLAAVRPRACGLRRLLPPARRRAARVLSAPHARGRARGRPDRRDVRRRARRPAAVDARRGPAVAWLYGIARRQLGTALRRGAVEDRARRRLGMAPLDLTDKALERIQAEADVAMTALDRLPADQREAIKARVIDERGYAEIAVSAQTSEAVVRKRVSRGLAGLRSRMGGDQAMTTSSPSSRPSWSPPRAGGRRVAACAGPARSGDRDGCGRRGDRAARDRRGAPRRFRPADERPEPPSGEGLVVTPPRAVAPVGIPACLHDPGWASYAPGDPPLAVFARPSLGVDEVPLGTDWLRPRSRTRSRRGAPDPATCGSFRPSGLARRARARATRSTPASASFRATPRRWPVASPTRTSPPGGRSCSCARDISRALRPTASSPSR